VNSNRSHRGWAAPRKGSKISSQPEADEFVDPDLIIPWPVVGAVICIVAFFVVAIPVAGRSAVAFDSFFVGNACAGVQPFERHGFILIALTNRLFNSIATWSIALCVVLGWAFAANAKFAAVQMIVGPLPVTRVQRKTQLRAAEVLIGVLVAVWLACSCAKYFVQRHGPVGLSSLPDMTIAGGVAFWGALASLSRQMDWRPAWRRIATGLFVIMLPFSIFSGFYTCRDWPSDVAASLLLGAAILCMALYALDVHVRESHQ
jgi:hypothetical protein